MTSGERLKVGKKVCPACAETVKAEARVCKHCQYRFTDGEMKRQADFEAKTRRQGTVILVIIVCLVAYFGCFRSSSSPAPTTATAPTVEDTWPAGSKLLARATAGAILKERMKNPPSFDLVESDANEARTDDGQPCWLVAVTYRGTNGFGGVLTPRAMVWVDPTGNTPLKVVDIPS